MKIHAVGTAGEPTTPLHQPVILVPIKNAVTVGPALIEAMNRSHSIDSRRYRMGDHAWVSTAEVNSRFHQLKRMGYDFIAVAAPSGPSELAVSNFHFVWDGDLTGALSLQSMRALRAYVSDLTDEHALTSALKLPDLLFKDLMASYAYEYAARGRQLSVTLSFEDGGLRVWISGVGPFAYTFSFTIGQDSTVKEVSPTLSKLLNNYKDFYSAP